MLDALEQAIHARRPAEGGGLIHHSDRGSQYLSIRYTERLGEAGIAPSVGSVGDSYDNALAETVIGLFRTEVIRRGPWRSFEAVEIATLEWVTGLTTAACSSQSATSPRRGRGEPPHQTGDPRRGGVGLKEARLRETRRSSIGKLVVALRGGTSWGCSRASIFCRERDLPHGEAYTRRCQILRIVPLIR